MKMYLVGGAVRDKLLGRSINERDWVVVGATPEQMQAQGYKPVGKDFPVFLHPKTKEEYALARTERKIGKGYKGFEFYADSSVTLEEDLKRRDLTINAIAEDEAGQLIDPYHGQDDINHKIFRHVSSAFVEDPVRILRVARFAARFPDFSLAPETLQLMQTMVANGEVDALVPERVWKEWHKALIESDPQRFITVLKDCGALTILLPEFDELIKQDNVNLTLSRLHNAAQLDLPAAERFAVLMFNLKNDEAANIEAIKAICHRYHAPNHFVKLATNTVNYFKLCQNSMNGSAEDLLLLFESIDAFRQSDNLNKLIKVCTAIVAPKIFPQSEFLITALDIAAAVDVRPIIELGYQGEQIKMQLHAWRLQALEKFIA